MASPPDKFKLAYVVKYYYPMPRISGILRFVLDLIEALAPDFEVRVFTYRYSPGVPEREEYEGYEVVRLSSPFPWKAGRAVRAWKPDAVVFGSGFWRPYFLLPYWEIFRAALGRFPGPVILTQYTNMTSTLSALRGLLLPRPSAVVATTETLKSFWERSYPGKVYYIPPGLKPPGGGRAPKEREVRIGYFGHLQPHKGPDLLLRVFQEIDPTGADLLINGEGELEESLKERARGWENVTIQGYVPDIDPWLNSCDLLVLPYRSGVSVLGYSRAALDALMIGVPVVTTPNPAVAPLIEDGWNGFVCRDEGELKEKIEALLGDKELREKLSRGARKSAARFAIERIAGEYRELIRLVNPKTQAPK